LLALAAGALGGAVLDQFLDLRAYRFNWQRRAQRARQYRAAHVDPRQWAADSARQAALQRDLQSRWSPREIGRTQALTHCVIGFEVRDTMFQHAQLFEAEVWDRSQTGIVIARGYTFARTGFHRGDTMQVVIPNVWCGDVVVGGYGTRVIGPPATPPRLDVR
jgi:hypothetical protein